MKTKNISNFRVTFFHKQLVCTCHNENLLVRQMGKVFKTLATLICGP
jgi:hypothetical protein